MDVEIKDTKRTDLLDGADFIPDEEFPHSYFQKAKYFIAL